MAFSCLQFPRQLSIGSSVKTLQNEFLPFRIRIMFSRLHFSRASVSYFNLPFHTCFSILDSKFFIYTSNSFRETCEPAREYSRFLKGSSFLVALEKKTNAYSWRNINSSVQLAKKYYSKMQKCFSYAETVRIITRITF